MKNDESAPKQMRLTLVSNKGEGVVDATPTAATQGCMASSSSEVSPSVPVLMSPKREATANVPRVELSDVFNVAGAVVIDSSDSEGELEPEVGAVVSGLQEDATVVSLGSGVTAAATPIADSTPAEVLPSKVEGVVSPPSVVGGQHHYFPSMVSSSSLLTCGSGTDWPSILMLSERSHKQQQQLNDHASQISSLKDEVTTMTERLESFERQNSLAVMGTDRTSSRVAKERFYKIAGELDVFIDDIKPNGKAWILKFISNTETEKFLAACYLLRREFGQNAWAKRNRTKEADARNRSLGGLKKAIKEKKWARYDSEFHLRGKSLYCRIHKVATWNGVLWVVESAWQIA